MPENPRNSERFEALWPAVQRLRTAHMNLLKDALRDQGDDNGKTLFLQLVAAVADLDSIAESIEAGAAEGELAGDLNAIMKQTRRRMRHG